jgi:hypothetical protein
MTSRKEPKWFAQRLAERANEEEDASYYFLLSSEWMSVPHFITDAKGHFWDRFIDAESFLNEDLRFEDEMRGAFETAYAASEPWVRLHAPPPWLPHPGPIPNWLHLHPRAAVLWLLSKPMYRRLVPTTWARVVLRNAKATLEEKTSGKPALRARGPRPELSARVKQEMRAMEEVVPGRLGNMQGKEMTEIFRASRTMCRELRKRVLSESRCGGVSNSAKI